MTATITEQEVDTDWLHEVDSSEKQDIPCDSKDEKVAKWQLFLSCCGNCHFVCQECFDRILEEFADPRVPGMECVFCKAVHRPSRKILSRAEKI